MSPITIAFVVTQSSNNVCMHTLQRPAHHVIARGLTPGCQLEASKEHVSTRRLSAKPCSSCHVRPPPGAALHTEELPSLKRRLHAHDVPVCNALLIMSLLRPSHVATFFVKASHGALHNRQKDQRRRYFFCKSFPWGSSKPAEGPTAATAQPSCLQ